MTEKTGLESAGPRSVHRAAMELGQDDREDPSQATTEDATEKDAAMELGQDDREDWGLVADEKPLDEWPQWSSVRMTEKT